MPQYDFRCEACAARFSITYRSYREYDSAAPVCPKCESAELSRLITSVAFQKTARNYSKMSSGEMLSVLESGDRQQVDQMFKQVGGGPAAAGAASKPADESAGS